MVFETWDSGFYGIIDGLFWEKGIFNDTPLYNFLYDLYNTAKEKEGGNPIKRKVVVGSCDTQTGEYWTFTEKLGDKYPQGVLSSASIPGVFEI